MKVAISADRAGAGAEVDPRFGRAACFVVFDLSSHEMTTADNTINQSAAHGAGIQAAKTVADAGAQAVITGNVGPKAFDALCAAGIRVYRCHGGSVDEAIAQYRKGSLEPVEAANT
jgi:predicted Fe-Mo cluster-binding NifX family protein